MNFLPTKLDIFKALSSNDSAKTMFGNIIILFILLFLSMLNNTKYTSWLQQFVGYILIIKTVLTELLCYLKFTNL